MLPKPVQPERGSRKVLNGVEVWTIHNFTTEKGNVYETADGSFILPNGQPVLDKTILEYLPEEHKQRALAWWESRNGDLTMTEAVPETPESIRAQIETLSKKLSIMENAPEEQAGAEPAKVDEKPIVKGKRDRGLEALKQMGIGA